MCFKLKETKGKKCNEPEISNLPNKGLRSIIIRMVTEHGKREEHNKNFNKELECI